MRPDPTWNLRTDDAPAPPSRLRGWIAGLLLGLGACAPSGPETAATGPDRPAAPTPQAIATPPPEPTAPNAQSSATHVVLGEVDNGFRRVPIPLGTDYAFLVMNDGDEDHPSPRVAVGLRSERQVIACRSIADFEAALRRIPAGATLHRQDRCLRPASTGLDTGFLEGVEQALARSGVRVAPDTVVTCVCGR